MSIDVTLKRILFFKPHLLGKADKFACSLEVLTLKRSGSRESPARSALLLVLYVSDVAFGSPVNRVWYNKVAWRQEVHGGSVLHFTSVSVHCGHKLFIAL